MAVYLREDEVGHDPNLIGFPTLGSCMGLAVVTDNGLYGFHMPPGHEDRIGAFSAIYAGNSPEILLSCCRFSHRYKGANPFFKWLQEIKIFGRAIGYKGLVEGVNLSTLLGSANGYIEDKTESAYCQYTLASDGTVSVGASLTSNVTATKTVDLNTPIRRVASSGQSSVPYKSNVITGVASTSGNTMKVPTGNESIFSFTL